MVNQGAIFFRPLGVPLSTSTYLNILANINTKFLSYFTPTLCSLRVREVLSLPVRLYYTTLWVPQRCRKNISKKQTQRPAKDTQRPLNGPSTWRKNNPLRQTRRAAETWYCLVYGTHRFPRGPFTNSFHAVVTNTNCLHLVCDTNCLQQFV